MVDLLAKEDKYWLDTLNYPKLWDERKRKTENAKAAHLKARSKARFTAADYLGCGKRAGRRDSQTSTMTTTTTNSSNQSLDLGEDKDEDDVIGLVGSQPPSPLSPHSTLCSMLASTSVADSGLCCISMNTSNTPHSSGQQ
jgi:hypothetical protein